MSFACLDWANRLVHAYVREQTLVVFVSPVASCAIFRDTTELAERDVSVDDDAGPSADMGAVDIGEDRADVSLRDIGVPDLSTDAAMPGLDAATDVGSETDATAQAQLPGCAPHPTVPVPDAIVGTGNPGSCTEQALRDALVAGSVSGFDCGPNAISIPIDAPIDPLRDIILVGEGAVTIDGQGLTRLFTVTGEIEAANPHLRLFGMTLRGGYRLVSDNADDCGAAAHLYGGSLTAVDTVFDGDRCDRSGSAVPFGGAISAFSGGGVRLYDSVVQNNRSHGRGGIYTFNADVELHRTTVTGNTAEGMSAGGLGLFGDANVVVCGSTVSDNEAIRWGGVRSGRWNLFDSGRLPTFARL